jgi:hypothetical protein
VTEKILENQKPVVYQTGPPTTAIQARPGWKSAKALLEQKAREEAELLRKRWTDKTEKAIQEGTLEPKGDQQPEEVTSKSDGSSIKQPVTATINREAFLKR